MCGTYNPRFRESNNQPKMPVAESIAIATALVSLTGSAIKTFNAAKEAGNQSNYDRSSISGGSVTSNTLAAPSNALSSFDAADSKPF